MKKFEEIFKRGLIVSCQAPEGEPLSGRGIMARMALAAEIGGAIGIRANAPEDIKETKETVSIPVIGIFKKDYPGFEVRITPTFKEAKAIIEVGADAIAIDATNRPRPKGETLPSLLEKIRDNFDIPVMADVSNFEEGVRAVELGVEVVSTTLSGYTSNSKKQSEPDIELVKKLSAQLKIPIVAEGRYWTPEQSVKALKCGAYLVVVGSAITRPHLITKHFADKINSFLKI